MGEIDGVQAFVNQRSLTPALSGNVERPVGKCYIDLTKRGFNVHFLVRDPAVCTSTADDACYTGTPDLIEGHKANIKIALDDASRRVAVLLVTFFEDGVNSLIHRVAIFCLDVVVKDHKKIQRGVR